MVAAGKLALYGGVSAALWILLEAVTAGQIVAALFAVWVVTGGWRTLRIVYRTLPREIRATRRFTKLIFRVKSCEWNNTSVPELFQQQAALHPSKTAIMFEDERWTYKELDEYSNRVGNVFLARGFRKGDAVALFVENRPEFVATWLGLAKVGVIPALINFNLKEASLLHCIQVAGCKALIYGVELSNAVADIQDKLGSEFPTFSTGMGGKDPSPISGSASLDALLAEAPPSPPALLETLNYADKLLYIYTSGTTGMPKAAIIKHSRFVFFTAGIFHMMGLSSADVIYDPLPLYHSAGGMLGVGIMMTHGAGLLIRRRFSASGYWRDVSEHGCTVAQYIGETCRYLLNQPERPHDKQHQIRLMFGNGLRPQIWEEFQSRFNIPKICEFYGSTEGNANIVNMEGKTGAVGFVPPLVPWVYPCKLIRVDEDTGEPIRDKNGLCVKCEAGEPGEFIGMMIRNNPVRDFHGYADKKATQKKIVHDVDRKGDCAFRSGDILVSDEDGYFYFKDRTGDTFRWRGENVSTTEVEGVIQKALGSTMAAVYGVEVPGVEGRAGMAAVADPDGRLDLEQLALGIRRSLPTYAQPLFLRKVKHLDMTGTFKFKKVVLQKEGFDIGAVKDEMFFLDTRAGHYTPLTREVYDKICSGQMRL
ncbi:long-chain fatty acid transport protein 4-like isoform X1 [Pollicipes pollicipes]|uniref:long-chain fatty acid transport protein 4-like isoform X1 n=1 Tax=Pollicipes pollicipes TaxID=41117 RepID=UPI001885590C|nr:long-chain fatty acid transport protein 4-like isoform X1 [Pollicipes pollicipes]XP_037078683.1 long-chain fatty acid transport protein 4-like isoform X1 [Pollicipes pollicipes]